MTVRIDLDDETLDKLHKSGELRVEDRRGEPVVLMTVNAREELDRVIYDDRDWTADEMRAVMQRWLDDPEGWGAPGMEAYDELPTEKSGGNGENQ